MESPLLQPVPRKRMDHHFAVFNLHVNNAGKKADAEIIEQFGQEAFDKEIAPFHDGGIMSIWGAYPPSNICIAWIALCTYFANLELDGK